jgi:DNA-binding MarR family transcriptional regulator
METNWSQIWESLVETPFGLYTTWEESLVAACGLPALTFHVLQTLAQAPEGRLRLQELADAVRHSQSGTTRLVDRLEKDGLVARHLCEADRRVTWAVLSPGGRAAYDRALPAWDAFLARHLRSALSAAEADQLRALLGKLKATLDPEANTCPSQKKG